MSEMSLTDCGIATRNVKSWIQDSNWGQSGIKPEEKTKISCGHSPGNNTSEARKVLAQAWVQSNTKTFIILSSRPNYSVGESSELENF